MADPILAYRYSTQQICGVVGLPFICAEVLTAAQRLFGRPFPDPFDWVMEQMGELPRPRVSKKLEQPKRLTLHSVPA